MQINRTPGKDRFFQKSSVAQIEKYNTNKKVDNNLGHAHKKFQINTMFWLRELIFLVAAQNQFWDSNFPKSYLLPIRGYSWHKNKIKRIRRGCCRGNNFQDSTKEKL
jgi:hypothetical protein